MSEVANCKPLRHTHPWLKNGIFVKTFKMYSERSFFICVVMPVPATFKADAAHDLQCMTSSHALQSSTYTCLVTWLVITAIRQLPLNNTDCQIHFTKACIRPVMIPNLGLPWLVFRPQPVYCLGLCSVSLVQCLPITWSLHFLVFLSWYAILSLYDRTRNPSICL